ncbi:590_t:CDS:2 [Funneliformis geosporum]|uniref:590_t:CDS:1 n=1 Tax=Funneliformis geosporum TaxID=1117311 RepID=A0A9W4SR64_9GLOM|nr:590_t:CDS:2 [Funneliformis geosporum]
MYIQIFFDILVPDGETPDKCKEKHDIALKDDPKLLKQICLVDVETELDPECITIIFGFNNSDYNWHFIMERAYHLNILKWMWEQMIGKFETKEEIIKSKYCEKIGKSEEDPEEKEYMGGLIKIKNNVEDDFTSSFLKLSVEKKGSLKFFLQKCGLDSKADMPYDNI